MTHRFVMAEGRRTFRAFAGTGLETRPAPGLLYVPADRHFTDERLELGDGRTREISLADALGGSGLLAFVLDSGINATELDRQLEAVRRRNPGWMLAWLSESGAATGIGLAGRKQLGPNADISPAAVGSIKAKTRIQVAENLSIDFDRRTPVTLEVGKLEVLDARPSALLRFESAAGFHLSEGSANIVGSVTVDLFTETPGTFRFEADLPASWEAEIRHGAADRIAAAAAFAVPAGRGSVRLDPTAPFDHEKNNIGLPEGLTIITGWGNRSRTPIAVETLAGSAVVPQPAGDGTIYLTPSGPFGPTGVQDLVCGLSGAEYLKLDAGSVLSFMPGQLTGGGTATDATNVRTAWLSIAEEAAPAAYYAQSKTNGFHAASDSGFLPYVDITAAWLTSDTVIPTMPWLGYNGASDHTGNETSKLESQLESRLAATRFDRLLGPESVANPPTGGAESDGPEVVTPSGLRARVTAGAVTSLGVMKVGDDPMTIDTAAMPALQAALSADEQLIVMTEPPVFRGTIAETHQLRIDGWTFGFGRDEWLRNGTTMIVKQRVDLPLADLITSPEYWTRAESFTDDAKRTAGNLERWLAETGESEDPAKQDLMRRVLDDRSWQGVLFISVPAPLTALPDELQMLRMTDRDDGETGSVLAHHLTVDRRPVMPESGGSSVSGLLEYPLPGHAPDPGVRADGHEFTFTSLRVRFVDSAVTEFGADVEVSIDSFLNTTLSEPTTVVLRGEQQRRAGATHYSFDTEISPHATLAVKDATIAAARIARGDLVAEPGGLRFSFDGELDFFPPVADQPDLLGYRTLAYRRLDLVLVSGDDSGRARFSWDADSVELSGEAEPSSLPGQFPMRPVGLVLGAESELGSLGYQPVRLPSADVASTDVAPLGSRFIGVDFELDLGSMGGLSAVPGFVATMALFWSPDAKLQRRQLGLRFPGVDVGVHGFSLQDIVGVSCHAIALNTAGENGGYTLLMNGLALNMLGFEVPWSGTINARLAPDPEGSKVLGWMGSYTGPKEPSENERQLPRSMNRVR